MLWSRLNIFYVLFTSEISPPSELVKLAFFKLQVRVTVHH